MIGNNEALDEREEYQWESDDEGVTRLLMGNQL